MEVTDEIEKELIKLTTSSAASKTENSSMRSGQQGQNQTSSSLNRNAKSTKSGETTGNRQGNSGDSNNIT